MLLSSADLITTVFIYRYFFVLRRLELRSLSDSESLDEEDDEVDEDDDVDESLSDEESLSDDESLSDEDESLSESDEPLSALESPRSAASRACCSNRLGASRSHFRSASLDAKDRQIVKGKSMSEEWK